MHEETVKIVTRGSKLALYQANMVKKEIQDRFPEIIVEIVVLKTKGDTVLDVSLSKIGDKGLFTKELENSLLQNETDIAVHSLKDLPTDILNGLTISGVLKRGDCRDALVSHKKLKLSTLEPGHIIATSSLRRKAQLLKLFPGIQVIDIRGNVDTRIRKMKEGYCDAMIMAAAGLQRLGLDEYIAEIIESEVMVPAVSQGAIAMQSRSRDERIINIIKKISHDQTYISTKAERVFLRLLEGGCQIPIGCYSSVENNTITITGFLSDINGNKAIKETLSGPLDQAMKVANELAVSFLSNGAALIVRSIRELNE